jgi:carboxyl-terminal processing protease
MNRTEGVKYLRVSGWMLMVILFFGCNSDEPLSENEYINKWILENMEFYYLWNDDIPNSLNKSQEPEAFFESLLSEEDRFSWIQDNYQELLNSLQGVNKEAGYEFKLYREGTDNENVIAQVVYIKAGSPVASKDVRRGDVITHINGELMTLSNYQSLLGQIDENHNITYKRNNGSDIFVDMGTLSLTTVEFAENPNFFHTVLDYPNHKIGYYVYNFFASGPTQESVQYLNEMNQLFTDFQTAGITDLILDLRYNSGGSEGATIRLASLIGSGVDNTKTFVRREYNNELEEVIINDPDLGSEFLVKKFENRTENVGNQISGKVYVLTGSRTASASELLINGLRPYMSQVFIVGDTTVGKNVGSISLYELNDPKNTWGMQPIVVKSYNSLNESDYSDGFIPDVADKDNSLFILPLGDPEENLLSIAIAEITGTGGRKGLSDRRGQMEMIGSSVDRKRGRFNLLIDDDKLRSLFKSRALAAP